MSEHNEHRRDEPDNDEEEGGGSASTKRLKSSEPDLAIVCRFLDEGNKEETIMAHSVAMAIHSKYFDTLLSSGMQESESKTVTLEGVDARVFRLALEILEDPLKTASVTAQEIMKVAPMYNRFEFSNGLKLAESVLGKYLDDWRNETEKTPLQEELEIIVGAINFSSEANLKTLIKKSSLLINQSLIKLDSSCSLAITDERILAKIEPFLQQNRPACVGSFISTHFRSFSAEYASYLDTAISKDYHLAQKLSLLLNYRRGKNLLQKIKLTVDLKVKDGQGETLSFSGKCFSTHSLRAHTSIGTKVTAVVGRAVFKTRNYDLDKFGDWALWIKVGGKLSTFAVPFSRNLALPPTEKKSWRLRSTKLDKEVDFIPSIEDLSLKVKGVAIA